MFLRFETKLPCAPRAAWQHIKYIDNLKASTRGLMGIETIGTPNSDEWRAGETYTFRLKLFHFVPWAVHEVKMIKVDSNACSYTTEEKGGAVRWWNHHLTIEPTKDGCVRRDVIEFEAGMMAAVVWPFSQVMYRLRHRRLRKLVSGSLNANK